MPQVRPSFDPRGIEEFRGGPYAYGAERVRVWRLAYTRVGRCSRQGGGRHWRL
jgi:hypothetical protein